jgi:hypothetical protein
MDASTVGLLFLMAAWIIQMAYVLAGKKNINRYFLIVYAVGSVILVLDGFSFWSLTTRAWQNLVILACVAVILLKIKK